MRDKTICRECGGPRSEATPPPDRDWGRYRFFWDEQCQPCAERSAKAYHSELLKEWFRVKRSIGDFLTDVLWEECPGFDRESFEKVKAFKFYDADADSFKNVLLHGSPGLGKTRMAAWLCERTVMKGEDCEWVSELKFFEAIGDIGRPGKRDKAEEQLDRWATVDFLFYDDLGAAPLTEARATRLFELVNQRYATNSPTIYTTNRSPGQLARRIERFWIGNGYDPEEARDEADKFLRRIFGTNEAPLVKIIQCNEPKQARAAKQD